MRSISLALIVSLAAVATAQTPTHISPRFAASGFGNSNNNIPFSWTPTAYQQVHDLASFNNQAAAVINTMRLRMANGFANRAGGTIDVEIWMADSPNNAANASGVFSNNVTLGTEVNVVPRMMISLPQVPNNDWAVAPFPFTASYPFTGQSDVSWRAIQWGNSNNNQLFTYPLDAWSGSGTSANNGAASGCASATGTAAATHSSSMSGPGGTSNFTGNSYVVAGGLPAVLSIGISGSNWNGIPLPFDLAVFGAPGCFIGNSIDLNQVGVTVPGNNGAVTIPVPIPGNPFLQGGSFYTQYLFLEATANNLGIFTTNSRLNTIGRLPQVTRIYAAGNPTSLSGTLGVQYGMAIGLN